jgi:hypothetical protein
VACSVPEHVCSELPMLLPREGGRSSPNEDSPLRPQTRYCRLRRDCPTSGRSGIVQEKSGRTLAEMHISAHFLPLGVGPNAWHFVSRDQLDSVRRTLEGEALRWRLPF